MFSSDKNILSNISNILETCRKCIDGGMFIAGGINYKKGCNVGTNQTEFIDETDELNRCNSTLPFPYSSTLERFGMVGTSLGNGSALFCGGALQNTTYFKAFKNCYR